MHGTPPRERARERRRADRVGARPARASWPSARGSIQQKRRHAYLVEIARDSVTHIVPRPGAAPVARRPPRGAAGVATRVRSRFRSAVVPRRLPRTPIRTEVALETVEATAPPLFVRLAHGPGGDRLD